ncbi:MAG: zinc-binding alcohol dehydrogenase [Candidatus Handelsmanbacteria bacterium]|nr:zinc-binding alcohol dehydrogenase [Candidatus Handelsmanbacteria bacterium]
MKTWGVVWPGPGQVAIEERQLPDPGPGELLLAAERTLISPGTERAFLLNLPNTSGSYPQRPGYNFAGRVEKVGAGVEGFSLGQRVVAAGPHAAHALVRASQVCSLPAAVPFEVAAFFNMGTIALQGVRRARIELGEATAVIGQGLVGLLALKFARLQGAAPLIAVDPEQSRLAYSRSCGADLALTPAQAGELAEAPAVVIEATGAPAPINSAFQLARPGGRVVLLASTRGETQVNFYREVHRKGLSVIGAHNSARPYLESQPGVWTWMDDVGVVLRLLELGRLEVADLVSHRLPARRAEEAYGLLAQWHPSLLGVLLEWR